jgi:signal transduction histidine kinase
VAVRDREFAGRLVDGLRSGLLGIDARGAVAALNEAAVRILRLPIPDPTETLGRDCREVLASEPTLLRLLVAATAGGEPPARAELQLEAEAGDTRRTIGFTLIPLAGGAGAALLFRDLTPFERMDEQERLRERLAALGQMAAGLAHEIRNPLASVEVIAGLLRRRLRGPDELDLLADLQGELHRIAGTVSDCLEFVRPVSPSPGRFDPIALVEESLTLALSRAPFPGVVLRRYAEDLPALLADREQVRSVVTNLVVNAVEAMEATPVPERRLEIALATEAVELEERVVRLPLGRPPEPAARRLVIEVADSGPGIPEAVRDRIFYPFFTTKKSGAGIGLATAQKLVAGQGGSIEVESREGRGARFRVRLPIRGGGP